MTGRRNQDWPQATAWTGYLTQDDVGKQTERVNPELVFARLITEGFVKGTDLVGYQPKHADLDALSGVGVQIYGKSLLAATDQASARATLGLAAIASTGSAANLTAGILPAARFDDAAHGNRAGGSLHASATTGASGFMSAADKVKLDGIADGANAYVHPNHSGDVTSVGAGAQTITAGVVTNAKLANMATAQIKGRVSAGSGAPEDLTAAQVWALISSSALGSTSATAYRGDRGTTAYDHSQVTGSNPHGTTFAQLVSVPAAISSVAALTPAADRLAYYTGASAAALAPFTAYGRSLVGAANQAAGLGVIGAQGANQNLTDIGALAGNGSLGKSIGGVWEFSDLDTKYLKLTGGTITNGLSVVPFVAAPGTIDGLRIVAPSGGAGGLTFRRVNDNTNHDGNWGLGYEADATGDFAILVDAGFGYGSWGKFYKVGGGIVNGSWEATSLIVNGSTIVNASRVATFSGLTLTGFSGMLVAVAGVVGAAQASDLPAHAARHMNGNDQIQGQSLSGLKITDSPTFAGLLLKGNILVDQDTNFAANSVDGLDQTTLTLCGGGSSSTARGAIIQVRGNERPSSGGTVTIAAGDTGAGAVQGEVQFSTGGTLRVTVKASGEVQVNSGAFRVGTTFAGVAAFTGGLLRQATNSDFPGALSTLANLANADGVLRNTGAGVLAWTPALPTKSYSTTGLGRFGGAGKPPAPAYLVATDNIGIGMADARSLAWSGGFVSSDEFWGLWQDASLSSSLKPFVLGDGAGNVWYKNDPLSGTAKHFFTGLVQVSAGINASGGSYKIAGVDAITNSRAGRLTNLQVSDLGQNYIPRVSDASGTLGNSNIQDNGTYVTVGVVLRADVGIESTKAIKVGSHSWSGGGGPNSNRVCSGVVGGSLGLFSGSHYEDSGSYTYLELKTDGFHLGGVSPVPNLLTNQGYIDAERLKPRGLYFQPTNVTTSSTAADADVFRRSTTPGLTETLPLATGSGRVLEFRYSGTSGSWVIQRAGTDVINNNGSNAATVTSVTLYASTGVPNLRLWDAAPGIWERIAPSN